MIFPYIEFLGLSEERVFRPMIPVSFRVGKILFKSYCLIDSGADYTVLPISLAKKFGMNLTDVPHFLIAGANGSHFTIYKSPIQIEHVIEKSGKKPLKWSSHVYFSASETTFLLGQKGFLENFKVVLNGKKRKVEILR